MGRFKRRQATFFDRLRNIFGDGTFRFCKKQEIPVVIRFLGDFGRFMFSANRDALQNVFLPAFLRLARAAVG
jgi:hypothetical protein